MQGRTIIAAHHNSNFVRVCPPPSPPHSQLHHNSHVISGKGGTFEMVVMWCGVVADTSLQLSLPHKHTLLLLLLQLHLM